MPRFPGFSRRKSAANTEDAENTKVVTPSFNVLPRDKVATGRSFESGTTAGRGPPGTRQSHDALYPTNSFTEHDEDNMFAVLKAKDRGSASSNTTKTVSTDDSSRRSDVSYTPPSSTFDSFDDPKSVSKKALSEIPVPPVPPVPKTPSNFLRSAAGRSWSLGQKKTATPPTSPRSKEPEWREGDNGTRSRAMTASTSATVSSSGTATAPRVEDGDLDLGNDFNTNMFKGLADKRASMLMPLPGEAIKAKSLGESRPIVPAPLHIDKTSRIEASPPSWNSQTSNDKLLTSPPPPRQPSPATDMADDGDTALLADTLMAGRALGAYNSNPSAAVGTGGSRRQLASAEDNNLFQSLPSVRPAHRFPPKEVTSGQHKVMTPAQFEQYRRDKERQGKMRSTDAREDSDEEDDKYDDDDDEAERARQAAKDRNKRQAHMTLYRQQMTKIIGDTSEATSSSSSSYPGISVPTGSASTPNLLSSNNAAAPPPPELVLASEDDGDDDVPLAILQQHGFPSKTRPPIRTSNMRASYIAPTPRSQSSLGGDMQRINNRHSALPAFARNLPQDPFAGAGLGQPPVRESLPYGGGLPAPQPQIPVGGLVGVIASEERCRALRRGSPQPMGGRFAGPLLGHDPALQMPPPLSAYQHSPYGMNPMASSSQPSLSQSSYGQTDSMLKMQMQLMQLQMNQMQLMQGGAVPNIQQQQQQLQQQQLQLQQQLQPSSAMGMQDPSAIRHSVATDSLRERPRFDAGMRTMSMVQPSSSSWVQPGAPSIRISAAPGYTPSIAPSERSTMGMPGRYRPVSQLIPANDGRRVSTMPNVLGGWDTPGYRESKSEPRLSTMINQTDGVDDGNKSDDDDEGWAALQAKREKTKSMWKKKPSGSGFMSDLL